jgi:hypothetical protein
MFMGFEVTALAWSVKGEHPIFTVAGQLAVLLHHWQCPILLELNEAL